MASFFQKWIDLIIKTSSISSELLEALMVQMAGIEPARFIQPQDFKNFEILNTYCYLTSVNSF